MIIVSSSIRFGLLLLPLTAVFIYVMQRLYLPSQHQLRILETQSNASLDAHLKVAQAGLEHIRGLEQELPASNETFRLIDCASKMEYRTAQILTRLRFIGDLYNSMLAIFVISSALMFPANTSTAILALALHVVSDSADIITWGFISEMDQVGQRLDSVLRIRDFIEHAPQEEDEMSNGHLNIAPGQWPSEGGLDFENTTITQR